MSFKAFTVISLALMISLPAWSGEKKAHRKANRGPASIASSQPQTELTRIYQSLMKDSQKQLQPSIGEHSVYLPHSFAESGQRAPAADARYQPTVARHAAIPWAAEPNLGGAIFSVK